MQRNRARMVLNLFAECVGEPSEAAHVHPHREVLALNVRRADVFRIGVAGNLALLGSDADCRAISLLALRLRAIDFLQHTRNQRRRRTPYQRRSDTDDDRHWLAARDRQAVPLRSLIKVIAESVVRSAEVPRALGVLGHFA